MTTSERHEEISAEFLRKARSELDAGDLMQASEKAWGAVAHCIKALSEEHGWAHETHRRLHDNAIRLLGTPDPYALSRMQWKSVSALHQNFYEERLDREDVLGGIHDAELLLEALKAHRCNGNC